MISKFKHLLKDTFIYGVTTILARGINYLLVPIYANVLSVAENGVQGIIYANVGFLIFIYLYGMDVAYMKFSSLEKNKHTAYGTATISLLLSSFFFSILIIFFADVLCMWMKLDSSNVIFIQWMSVVMFFDTMASIPLTKLRLENKALYYGGIKLVNVLMNVCVSLVLLIKFDVGLYGIFIGNLTASLVSLLLTLPFYKKEKFSFDKLLWIEFLKYGIPLLPNGIATIAIDFIDRNVLVQLTSEEIYNVYHKHLSNTELLGIYTRIYALGMVVQLAVQIYRIAWPPFAFAHQNDDEAKKLYSKVLSVSTIAIMIFSLFASMFVPFFIQYYFFNSFYILPPMYWIGLSILPILYCSYVFDVLAINFTTGLLLEKKTMILPMITGIGAGVTFLLCVILIPILAMTGAAIATTTGSFIMFVGTAYYSNKYFSNNYEWNKLIQIFVITCSVFLVHSYFEFDMWQAFILFFIYLIVIAFVLKSEVQTIRNLVRKSYVL